MTALQIDVTGVVQTGLRAQLGITYRVGAETPDDLESACPFVKVVRAGGGDDGHVLDIPTLVLEVFDNDNPAAGADSPASKQSRLSAYSVIGAMYALRGQTVSGAAITYVRKLGGPTPLPYANTAVRRQAVTFQIRCKPA